MTDEPHFHSDDGDLTTVPIDNERREAAIEAGVMSDERDFPLLDMELGEALGSAEALAAFEVVQCGNRGVDSLTLNASVTGIGGGFGALVSVGKVEARLTTGRYALVRLDDGATSIDIDGPGADE